MKFANRALLITAMLLLFSPSSAWPDVLAFPQVAIGKGYVGPIVVAVKNADGTARDVTGAAGTLTVYQTAPVGGSGGTVRFTKSLTAGLGGLMNASLTGTDTAIPGTYYSEVTVTLAGVTDAWHGTVVIEGR